RSKNKSESETQALKNEISRLRIELESAYQELTSVGNVQQIKQDILEKDEKIKRLEAQLTQSYADFELLSLDWDALTSAALTQQKNTETTSSVDLLKTQKRYKQRIKMLKNQNETLVEKLKNIEKKFDVKDAALVEVMKRMDDYEKGVYGLTDAIREIKTLKLQKSIRDKEIIKLTGKVNDFELQVQDFLEENNYLRAQLSLPPTTKIDVSNLRLQSTLENEKYKSMCAQLQSEVNKLEQERIDLKQKCRVGALERAEKAVVEFGIGVEDFIAVQCFAEKLRSRGAEVADGSFTEKIQRPEISNEHLEKLLIELERINVEAQESREKAEKLQRELSESKSLVENLEMIVKEISQAIVDSNPAHLDKISNSKSLKSFPAIDKLLARLQSAPLSGKPKFDTEAGETNASLIQVTNALRQQILALTTKSESLTSKLSRQSQKISKLEADRDFWANKCQEQQKTSLWKSLDIPIDLMVGELPGYNAVLEQLVRCVLELKEKNSELADWKSGLEEYEQKFLAASERYRSLQTELSSLSSSTTKQINALSSKLYETETSLLGMTQKATQFESLINKLNYGPDDIRRELVESRREAVVLRVNEVVLSRKYLAVAEREKNVNLELEKLKFDKIQTNKATAEKISLLEKLKNNAEHRLHSLSRELSHSVSSTEHSNLENKLNLYISKTRVLLQKEIDFIEKNEENEANLRNLKSLQVEVSDMQLKLKAERARADKMEESFLEFTKYKELPDIQDRLKSEMYRNANLSVQIKVLQDRAELAEQRLYNTENNENQLRSRLNKAEQLYMDVCDENIRTRELELETKNKYQGGATAEENQLNLKKITDLKSTINSLEKEILHYKSVAEVATTQATDLTHLQSQISKQTEILNTTIEELQSQSEEKLVIGKLHHHILALQLSEATAIRKLETLNLKCVQYETRIAKLENLIDAHEHTMYQMRLDHKSRNRMLLKSLSETRSKIAGTVLLDKHERTCDLVLTLDHKRSALEKQLDKALKSKRKAEDELGQIKIKLQSQEELISELSKASPNHQQISNWQSKMTEVKLQDLKLQKDIEYMTQDRDQKETSLKLAESKLQRLSEEVVRLQDEHEVAVLDWEKRHIELEEKVEKLEEERERIYLTTSSSEIKKILPDRSLPINQQLDAALRMILERGQMMTAMELKLEETKNRYADLKSKYSIDNKTSGKKTRSILQNREADAINAAQETITSLQDQIETKNQLLQKYQNMISDIRNEMTKRKLQDRAEIERMTETLNSMSDRLVEKVRNPQELPQPETVNVPDPTVFEKFEKIIASRDSEINQLRMTIKELENEYSDDAEATTEKINNLRSSLAEKDDDIASLKKEIDDLKDECDEMREKLSNAPPASLHDDIARLKRLLMKKDDESENMVKLISDLKAAMIKQSEEDREAEISSPKSYTSKIMQMEQKISRLTEENESLKSDILNFEKKLSRKEQDFVKREKESASQTAEIQRLNKLLREKMELFTRERSDLTSEIQELKSNIRNLQTRGTTGKLSTTETAHDATQARITIQKLTSKIETLKSKLKLRTTECESLTSQLKLSKESYLRSEKERIKLQQKVTSMLATLEKEGKILKEKKPSEPSGGDCVSPSSNDGESKEVTHQIDSLKAQIEDFEQQAEKWKKIAEVDKEKEILSLKALNAELNVRLENEKLINEQNDSHATGDRSKVPDKVMESRIRDLLNKNEALDTQRLTAESNLLQFRFQVEQLNTNLDRANKKCGELEETIKNLRKEEAHRIATGNTTILPGLNIPLPLDKLPAGLKTGLLSDKPLQDLILVIEYLSNQIEKLNQENKSLKQTGTSNLKYMELVKEVKQLKKEKAGHDALIKEKSARDALLSKIELENTKLRRNSQKQIDTISGLQKTIQELRVSKESLESDVNSLRKVLSGLDRESTKKLMDLDHDPGDGSNTKFIEEISQLRAMLNERDTIIKGLMNPETNDQANIISQNRHLKREVSMWQARVTKLTDQLSKIKSVDEVEAKFEIENLQKVNEELRQKLNSKQNDKGKGKLTIPKEMEDELEDLKYNYKEALKINLRFEEVVKSLCGRCGLDSEKVISTVMSVPGGLVGRS
ncbi:hypothetical protein HK098_005020, partial [Nowakowskiella sp. JEL0407]